MVGGVNLIIHLGHTMTPAGKTEDGCVKPTGSGTIRFWWLMAIRKLPHQK
jgi:hypothetical protein